MDPRLLRLYEQELRYFREAGSEFAREFPKIAARLGMDGQEVADPYVERLIESTAFLGARVALKLDAEFPRFNESLLNIVYPHYLQPTPAMAVTCFHPNLLDANLAKGVTVPRGTALRALRPAGQSTYCEFRTGSNLTLWPIELQSADYFSFAPDLPLASIGLAQKVKGGLRLRLRATAGLTFDQIAMDVLSFHFAGNEDEAFRLHELCLSRCIGVLVGPATRPMSWHRLLPGDAVRQVGLEDDEALLPVTLPTFQGYRLLQEYFAFPQRLLFAEVQGLRRILAQAQTDAIDICLLFSAGAAELEGMISTESIALNCTPVVNLFPKRADRIHVSDSVNEFHVVPDRTRPMDFEVHSIREIVGYGAGNASEETFHPFYSAFHTEHPDHLAYFTARREPRLLSINQRKNGHRTSYTGSEVYVSLVDPKEAPFSANLKQLSIDAMCTNRDLPLIMPLSPNDGDFSLEASLPVERIQCIRGPSKPFSPVHTGTLAWRLVDHLSLNYLSLLDASSEQASSALRDILDLYVTNTDPAMRTQLRGLVGVKSKPLVRRLPLPGPIAFGRGLEITLTVDESAFHGASAFLFASVLSRFLARHVTMNSFVETVLRSSLRGDIMRWTPSCGAKPIF